MMMRDAFCTSCCHAEQAVLMMSIDPGRKKAKNKWNPILGRENQGTECRALTNGLCFDWSETMGDLVSPISQEHIDPFAITAIRSSLLQ